MIKGWWGRGSVALQSEVIQVAGVDMGPGFEPETVKEVLPVVFLSVEGPGQAAMLLLVVVEELDGPLAVCALRVPVFEG